MKESAADRRKAENEVIFRQYNERIQKSFDETKRIAKEDGQEYMLTEDNEPLHFYCECSDENCTERVLLQPSRYSEIHKARKRFVIVCGHETLTIEKLIHREAGFCIVEKFMPPPEKASGLNTTDTSNSS